MNLFINDKPVNIISKGVEIIRLNYNGVILHKDDIISKKLIGDVLIEDVNFTHIERLFKILEIKKLKKLNSLTLVVASKSNTVEFIKDQFKIVKAAGGIVTKDEKVLLIFRLSKWDLPKGKLKKKENVQTGGIREVEEECNVKVTAKDKLCSTWHTYIRKGKRVLKKTTWFTMDCVSDLEMQPQIEENIEEVRWVEKKDLKKCMKNSYKSIEKVFEVFYGTKDY